MTAFSNCPVLLFHFGWCVVCNNYYAAVNRLMMADVISRLTWQIYNQTKLQ